MNKNLIYIVRLYGQDFFFHMWQTHKSEKFWKTANIYIEKTANIKACLDSLFIFNLKNNLYRKMYLWHTDSLFHTYLSQHGYARHWKIPIINELSKQENKLHEHAIMSKQNGGRLQMI